VGIFGLFGLVLNFDSLRQEEHHNKPAAVGASKQPKAIRGLFSYVGFPLLFIRACESTTLSLLAFLLFLTLRDSIRFYRRNNKGE
jgi:hypothetical protein